MSFLLLCFLLQSWGEALKLVVGECPQDSQISVGNGWAMSPGEEWSCTGNFSLRLQRLMMVCVCGAEYMMFLVS